MKHPTHTYGPMSVTPLFPSSTSEPRTPSRFVDDFLAISEGYAHQWIDAPKGTLVLVMVPGTVDSGSIYIYDRERNFWYRLSFEGIDDTFTVPVFHEVYREYKLFAYIRQPGLLLQFVEKPAHELASADTPDAHRQAWAERDPGPDVAWDVAQAA